VQETESKGMFPHFDALHSPLMYFASVTRDSQRVNDALRADANARGTRRPRYFSIELLGVSKNADILMRHVCPKINSMSLYLPVRQRLARSDHQFHRNHPPQGAPAHLISPNPVPRHDDLAEPNCPWPLCRGVQATWS
jgi:hypothetical protein